MFIPLHLLQLLTNALQILENNVGNEGPLWSALIIFLFHFCLIIICIAHLWVHTIQKLKLFTFPQAVVNIQIFLIMHDFERRTVGLLIELICLSWFYRRRERMVKLYAEGPAERIVEEALDIAWNIFVFVRLTETQPEGTDEEEQSISPSSVIALLQ